MLVNTGDFGLCCVDHVYSEQNQAGSASNVQTMREKAFCMRVSTVVVKHQDFLRSGDALISHVSDYLLPVRTERIWRLGDEVGGIHALFEYGMVS